jgi:pyruvate formate lyase activating enzyme
MKKCICYKNTDSTHIQCELCHHFCRIENGKFGLCGVRKNVGEELVTFNYGNLIAQHVDPIEKKPLYHVLPGSSSYSIASPGCNFGCSFCQNFEISQLKVSDKSFITNQLYTPEYVVKRALETGCKSISFTYTEPTIYFEFALETSIIAKSYGLKTILVSNGYFTEKALEEICPYLDACNIDLKAFSDEFYKTMCKAHAEPVKETIKLLRLNNIWTEITTLLIPGLNDSETEIVSIAEFIANIDKDMPWHISRFFPRYKLNTLNPTSIRSIELAVEAGINAGLNYVYEGNVADEISTRCPGCSKDVIIRNGYDIIKCDLDDGVCRHCGTKIPGIWV